MSTALIPTVSLMGVMGPTGLMSVQVSTNPALMGMFQIGSPAAQLMQQGGLIPSQSFDSFRTYSKLGESNAGANFARLAGSLFPADGSPAVSNDGAINMGIETLAAAEAGLETVEELVRYQEIDGWMTSGGVFANIDNTPGYSLVVMEARRKEPLPVSEEKVGSPSIAAQKQAQSVLQGARTLYADVMRGHQDGYIKLWGSVDEMFSALGRGKTFEIMEDLSGGEARWLSISDKQAFRESMDDLVRNSAFNPNEEVRDAARWLIWEASQKMGAPSSSIHDLYMARARGEWKDMTVPAINIRGLTYDTARLIFRKLKEINAGAAIFEIAKSEIGYTDQRPAEYTATVLSAAIREGWEGAVFLQGDHFQVAQKDYKKDPEAAVQAIKDLIREAVEAGFYNIDLDTSTLVDLSKKTLDEQQRDNYEVAARLTRFIRSIEPKGITVSVGGEIGEIGTENSTPEELRAFMNGYRDSLGNASEDGVGNWGGPVVKGLSKISIQTGTSHGGVPLPDGSIAKVKIDFGVIEQLDKIAREEFGLGGVVQHGASTLPDEAFHHFRERGAIEVHLATAFQNVIYDSNVFPEILRDRIYASLAPKITAEIEGAQKKGKEMTLEQAVYKVRKNGLGPHKRDIWSLPYAARLSISNELEAKFGMLFNELNVGGTAELIGRFITPVSIHRPFGRGSTVAEIRQDDNPLAD